MVNGGFLLFDNVKMVGWIFALTMLSCSVSDDFLLVDNVKMVD